MTTTPEPDDVLLRLLPRSRVIVVTDPARHKHALHQLEMYLSGLNLEVVELEYTEVWPFARSDAIDLVVFLAESREAIPLSLAQSLPPHVMQEDAFVLQTSEWMGMTTLVALGGGRPGLIHAVNELGTRHLVVGEKDLILPSLDLARFPAMPYRLLWTWDHSTNWYLQQVGIQEIGALNYYSKPENGLLEDYCRLVDFMSLNRIGGVTIYGFLRDNHGGIEAARELCRYANERGVRILPGVGINAYGGIYWEGNHRYNLTTWLKKHPELRAIFDRPVAFHIPDFPKLWFPETHYTDAACPSKPENARYHEEAIQWLAETFEIGGINFETGDYGVCRCDDCVARRSSDDTWSLKDMALLYPRLFESARRGRSDLWLVSEAYWDNILDLDALAPLADLPPDAIYQFCMNRSYWPEVKRGLTREHVSRLPRPHNILRTHMGTQWNHERYVLVARRFAEMMQLLNRTGMQGATIFGEVSAFSAVNEINYLAFARFGYDADLSWERFIAEDLGPLLGGEDLAKIYLELLELEDDRRSLKQALTQSRELAASQSGGVYRRWIWLQNHLFQKLEMMA